MAEVVRCVHALQLSYTKSIATPANWPRNHGLLKNSTEDKGTVLLLPTISHDEAIEHFPNHVTQPLPSSETYLRQVKAEDVGVHLKKKERNKAPPAQPKTPKRGMLRMFKAQ